MSDISERMQLAAGEYVLSVAALNAERWAGVLRILAQADEEDAG